MMTIVSFFSLLQNNDSDVVISKQKFSRFQSIILCCLWTLYMDKVQSGSLSKQITTSFPELNAELEKFEYKGAFDVKKDLKTALQLLARYNLIFVNWNGPDNERVIVLYPSIQFALDESEFATFVTSVRERMLNADSQIEDVVDDGFDAEGEEE